MFWDCCERVGQLSVRIKASDGFYDAQVNRPEAVLKLVSSDIKPIREWE